MSSKGAPYDNAVAENLFSYFKCELIHLKQYPTQVSAQSDAYLEIFYNTIRPHSALSWLSPAQLSKPSGIMRYINVFPAEILKFFLLFFSNSVSVFPGRAHLAIASACVLDMLKSLWFLLTILFRHKP